MSDREELLSAATNLVIDRDAEGAVIDVNDAAAQLFRSHPNSGMSLQEIAVHIETMGVIVGATLLTGYQPDRKSS